MLPAKKEPAFKSLPTTKDLAKERFGDIEGLAIVTQTTLELASHYAGKFKLDKRDPEVNIISSALAFTRHKELLLLIEIERELFDRVSSSPDGASYGQVLFKSTKNGAFKDGYREVARLHSRAKSYISELRELRKESQRSNPGGSRP